jgi:Peptidase family M1 domain
MQSIPALLSIALLTLLTCASFGQSVASRKITPSDKFRQLDEIFPTANNVRIASGAPGPEYWQQEVDYVVDVTLDDAKQMIRGIETITYKNRSPHALSFLWLQVDSNIYRHDSDAKLMGGSSPSPPVKMDLERAKGLLIGDKFDGGANLLRVVDSTGSALKFTVVKTMMRIDLPRTLLPNEDFEFSIAWEHKINDGKMDPGRSGFEYFDADGNHIYEIAQWFPRLCAYTDVTGWQHKQYLGQGEFTLEFGNYLVRITAPKDHVVAATGVLQNGSDVLTPDQRGRLELAKSATSPVFIVTPDEAKENEKQKTDETKTWVFSAKRVRDFAFASSRKFIWDAMGHTVNGNSVMAMSYYPNEAEPLWSKFSTQAIVHTLDVYSRYTFDYPYPVACSINGPIYGMEYPMICFNGPRPEPDGTYSAEKKFELVSVIIHEVGHNYFPMVVNSDERQWTWMDEGLNTFLQYLSEQEWEDGYPSAQGEPEAIAQYMQSLSQVPIMTNSESIIQFGDNAYGKPATALNILRETILGRELFDFAFKEYARRWKFKRPMPADFFRTMEDASGVDLDWFWHGWFYTTDHVDISLHDVELFLLDKGEPEEVAIRRIKEKESKRPSLAAQRNKELKKRTDLHPELKDFYNTYEPHEVTELDRKAFADDFSQRSEEEKSVLEAKLRLYQVHFRNLGGLVMPIILHVTFEDGTERVIRLPAEIWRATPDKCSTHFVCEQPVRKIELDPYRETADTNRSNNYFPNQIEPTRFELFKSRKESDGLNPMQRAKKEKE